MSQSNTACCADSSIQDPNCSMQTLNYSVDLHTDVAINTSFTQRELRTPRFLRSKEETEYHLEFLIYSNTLRIVTPDVIIVSASVIKAIPFGSTNDLQSLKPDCLCDKDKLDRFAVMPDRKQDVDYIGGIILHNHIRVSEVANYLRLCGEVKLISRIEFDKNRYYRSWKNQPNKTLLNLFLQNLLDDITKPCDKRGKVLGKHLNSTSHPSTCWDMLESPDLDARCDALEECYFEDPKRLATIVVEKLKDLSLKSGIWRDELVGTAEFLDYEDQEERWSVSESMLRIAHDIKKNGPDSDDRLLWAALRIFTAKRGSEDAAKLLPFLGGGGVESRLVALQSISLAFEYEPPASIDEYKIIADHAHRIAMKYLDKDIFEAGYNSAVTGAATEVLAVLYDSRFEGVISILQDPFYLWFRSFVTSRLKEIAMTWKDNTSDPNKLIVEGLERMKIAIESLSE